MVYINNHLLSYAFMLSCITIYNGIGGNVIGVPVFFLFLTESVCHPFPVR